MSSLHYRNQKIITADQGIEIDPGALWRRTGDLMVLVDEDQYITFEFSKEIFQTA